jgi:hypothetical protein
MSTGLRPRGWWSAAEGIIFPDEFARRSETLNPDLLAATVSPFVCSRPTISESPVTLGMAVDLAAMVGNLAT